MAKVSSYYLVSRLEIALLSFFGWEFRCTNFVFLEHYFGRLVLRTFIVVFFADISSTLYRNTLRLLRTRIDNVGTEVKIHFSFRRVSWKQEVPYAGDETVTPFLGSFRIETVLYASSADI